MVGEGLYQNFQLTMKSRKDIERAVNELKVVGTLGDTLEIGFGIEDVVRLMAKSERGCVCLALCAALKECYSDGTYLFTKLYKFFLANLFGVLLGLRYPGRKAGAWIPLYGNHST